MPPIHIPKTLRRLAAAGALIPLAGVLAACGDVPSAPVEPPPPDAVYDILVQARVHGFDELFVVPSGGGAPVQLFAGEVNARHPAPSPGGLHVAYVNWADDEIWIANRVTGEKRNISLFEDDMDLHPSWSPDGTRLAFASYRSGGSDIYVVNADGSGLRNLSPNDFPAISYELSPAWSPDGTRIVLSSDRGGFRTIWSMRADGTDLVQLTNDPSARDDEPSWSPDGQRIVFRRMSAQGGVMTSDLAIMNADGSNLVRLVQDGHDMSPSWSPDGKRIAFISNRGGNEYRLFTMRPGGGEVTEVAGGAAYGWHVAYPRWIRRL